VTECSPDYGQRTATCPAAVAAAADRIAPIDRCCDDDSCSVWLAAAEEEEEEEEKEELGFEEEESTEELAQLFPETVTVPFCGFFFGGRQE
jgi:hypothetical protein